MSLIKYSLLVLLFSSIVQAAPDYHIVLSNDDQVRILDHIIDGINTFFTGGVGADSTSQRYLNLLKFVALLGSAYALINLVISSLSGGGAKGFKTYVMYLLALVFILGFAFGPTSKVLLQTRDGGAYAEQQVPQLVAFTFSFFTTLKNELNELSEIAYNIPNPADDSLFSGGGASGIGFVGSEAQLANLYKNATFSKSTQSKIIAPMYSRFIRDCVILPTIAGTEPDTRLTAIINSTNLWQDIRPVATGYQNEFVTYNGLTGKCEDFWAGGSEAIAVFGAGFIGLNAEIVNFDANTTEGSYNELGSALAFIGAMADQNTVLSSNTGIQNAVTQAVLSNEFRSTYGAMGIAGNVMANGAAKASEDIQLRGIATGLYMAEQLPSMAFLVFALMLAALPFILAFALLPGALKVILNYLKTLLWVTLWEPMSNILGLFMDYRFADMANRYGHLVNADGTLAINAQNLVNVSSDAATIAGMAGFMFVAVQGLSWMLITGSGNMMGNMMHTMNRSFQQHNQEEMHAHEQRSNESHTTSDEMNRAISQREGFAYSAQGQHQMTESSGFGRGGSDTGATHEINTPNQLSQTRETRPVQNQLETQAASNEQDNSVGVTGMQAGLVKEIPVSINEKPKTGSTYAAHMSTLA